MRYSSERTLPTHQKEKELTRRDSTTGPAPAHLRCLMCPEKTAHEILLERGSNHEKATLRLRV